MKAHIFSGTQVILSLEATSLLNDSLTGGTIHVINGTKLVAVVPTNLCVVLVSESKQIDQ